MAAISILDWILGVLGSIAIVATLLPMTRREAWWIRIFDYPRIHVAALAVAVLTADFLSRGDANILIIFFRILLTGCILFQIYMVYPYTLVASKEVQPSKAPREGGSFSLFIANVKMENRNAPGLRRIVRESDPDAILILEADEWWRNALAELKTGYPFTAEKPLSNCYGMLFYSRLKVLSSEFLFLIYDDVPAIRVRVGLGCGVEVELYGLHPKPPVPQEEGSSKERDAELLIVGRQSHATSLPTVVMGDLNDVAWSHTNYLFQRISGLLDPRIGRGFYNTFDARYPLLRFPLDHFFHSNHFRLITLRRLPYFESDHFPMYIELSYEPDAEREQKAEPPSSEDKREAAEKIEGAPTGATRGGD